MKKIIVVLFLIRLLVNSFLLGSEYEYFDTLSPGSALGIINKIKEYRDMGIDLYEDEDSREDIKQKFFRYLEGSKIGIQLIDRYKLAIELAEIEKKDLYKLYLAIESNVAAIKEFEEIEQDLDSYILFSRSVPSAQETTHGSQMAASFLPQIGSEEAAYKISIKKDKEGNFIIYNEILNRNMGIMPAAAERIFKIFIKDNFMHVLYKRNWNDGYDIRRFNVMSSEGRGTDVFGSYMVSSSMEEYGFLILCSGFLNSVLDTRSGSIYGLMLYDSYSYRVGVKEVFGNHCLYKFKRSSKECTIVTFKYGRKLEYKNIQIQYKNAVILSHDDYDYIFDRKYADNKARLITLKAGEHLADIILRKVESIDKDAIILVGKYIYIFCRYENMSNVLVIEKGKHIDQIFKEDVILGKANSVEAKGILYIPFAIKNDEGRDRIRMIKDGKVIGDICLGKGKEIVYLGNTTEGDGIISITCENQGQEGHRYEIISYIDGEQRYEGEFVSKNYVEVKRFYKHGRKMYVVYADQFSSPDMQGKNVKVIDIFDNETKDVFDKFELGDLEVKQLVDNIFFIFDMDGVYRILKIDISGNIEQKAFFVQGGRVDKARLGVARECLVFYDEDLTKPPKKPNCNVESVLKMLSGSVRYLKRDRRIIQDDNIREIDVDFIRQEKELLKKNIDKQVFKHIIDRYIRNVIRLKTCAPGLLEISKKTYTSFLIHNMCLDLETRELEIIGAMLDEVDEGVLSYMVRTYGNDADALLIVKRWKEIIAIEDKNESREKFRRDVRNRYIEQVLRPTALLLDQDNPDSDPDNMSIDIASYIASFMEQGEWEEFKQTFSGVISGNLSQETLIRIETKQLFKDDKPVGRRMIKLWRVSKDL